MSTGNSKRRESSWIKSVSRDRRKGITTLVLRLGGTYKYKIDEDVHARRALYDSDGQWYNHEIRNKFWSQETQQELAVPTPAPPPTDRVGTADMKCLPIPCKIYDLEWVRWQKYHLGGTPTSAYSTYRISKMNRRAKVFKQNSDKYKNTTSRDPGGNRW